MHDEVLSIGQEELLSLMKQFRREYYLVGGTAIALYIGHRRSVDFDLFKLSAINHKKNLDKICSAGFDLYFLLTGHFSLEAVSQKATVMFGDLFSEKLFRAQLSYFDDINYEEQVDYLIKDPPSEDTIKSGLSAIAINGI